MEKLTREIAVARVKHITFLSAFDNERAHIEEDILYKRFIECLKEGLYPLDEAIEVAKVLAIVVNMDFERWYS